jgi:4-oxalocrotonate tautomerase
MPMIAVRYVTPEPGPDLPEQIAALATRLAANHLGKRSEVTAVLVESAAPGSWFVAGQNPTRLGLSAFWLTITMTAGTNVKAETAAFIRAAFDGMQELLGPVREESYVLVQAVDGDAYGYGGRTQSARWADAHPG